LHRRTNCRGFLWSADGTRRNSIFVLAGPNPAATCRSPLGRTQMQHSRRASSHGRVGCRGRLKSRRRCLGLREVVRPGDAPAAHCAASTPGKSGVAPRRRHRFTEAEELMHIWAGWVVVAGCGLLDSGSKRCWHSHPADETEQHDRQSPASCASHAPKWTRSLHLPLPGEPHAGTMRGRGREHHGMGPRRRPRPRLCAEGARRPGSPPRGAGGPAQLATTAAPSKGHWQALGGSVDRLMARSTLLVRFAEVRRLKKASRPLLKRGKGPQSGECPSAMPLLTPVLGAKRHRPKIRFLMEKKQAQF
jgi:hypothetical protein